MGTDKVTIAVDLIKGKSAKDLNLTDTLSKYVFNKKYLIALDLPSKRIVLDKKIFALATSADATRNLEVTQVFSKLTPEGMKLVSQGKLDLRLLSKLFIESEIVTTYWHLQSSLCSSELDDKCTVDLCSFRYHGTHEYCTNECQSDPLDFRITYHRSSGEFTLDK
jgi:hypothetical protein